ncbi:MAG: CBS domain-containing protein [Thermodesulfobacteriota bacterium]
MTERRIRERRKELKDVPWFTPETKVGQAVLKLGEQVYTGQPAFALVVEHVGGGEEIVGTITLDDVLREMENSIRNPNKVPIFWEGQFQEEARRLMARPVADIMSQVKCALNQSGTLMEALHIMNSNEVEYLVTLKGQNVSGLLMREDLYLELIEIAQTPPP